MSKQYYVKVIRENNGVPVYFNFGMDKHLKYRNTKTSLSDLEYISITCYRQTEFDEYCEHVASLLNDNRAKLSIVI